MEVETVYPPLDLGRVLHELVRNLLGHFIIEGALFVQESSGTFGDAHPPSLETCARRHRVAAVRAAA